MAEARAWAGLLRRKPVIWDNLHANDYDGRRFYCGPYSGRPPELRAEVRGLLSNPNNEFPLNYVPLRTLAEYTRGAGAWDPRAAYLAALREWLPRFAALNLPASFDDLVRFGDCYYLPHAAGPEAEALVESARRLLARDPAEWGDEAAGFRRQAASLRGFCQRLAQLRDRPLFYALSRHAWELGEELDLLERYFDAASKRGPAGAACRSDFHLPGTYRGGVVPALQQLLVQHPDGTFTPRGCSSERVGQTSGLPVTRAPGPVLRARLGTRSRRLLELANRRPAPHRRPQPHPSPTHAPLMNDCIIRPAQPADQAAAYYVCLKTGDFGKDGEPFYGDDPDALGRIFVGPYLAFEPEVSLVLEDDARRLRLRAGGRLIRGRSMRATRRSGGPRSASSSRTPHRRPEPMDTGADGASLVSQPRLLHAGALRSLPVASAH